MSLKLSITSVGVSDALTHIYALKPECTKFELRHNCTIALQSRLGDSDNY